MSTLGRFLELSVPAPDLAESLDFWLQLGFTEIQVNDIRPTGYTAVTDGQIVVGLRATGLDEAALAFVRPDLARHARALVDAGTELVFQRLDDDQFNEVGLRTPDGQMLLLLEAPTFSSADDDIPVPLTGRCTGVSLACADPEKTEEFFERAGFLGTDDEETGAILLAAPGLSLALYPATRRGGLTLYFEPDADRLAKLESLGMTGRRESGGRLLIAPEGTRLLLRS